ncbi:hypothetical protein POX_f08369 [Penicillium oxalicum]|uniref:Uncharacterized protein n=1 Tax=Penicillium oxalicum (strain 114-2 / CGMCC 5302) TaxID=933388 RepID=S7ZKZ8_PENO1|nr:hypothetical protein POX_f08369 [Penicillium oxalicum]EPS29326.1 hypothetical protein PDE_04275 [Penicillium oxalicum 114-2]KAI2787986.1 hypothetical protein POX_f08369 [Penicillium oxalicum]
MPRSNGTYEAMNRVVSSPMFGQRIGRGLGPLKDGLQQSYMRSVGPQYLTMYCISLCTLQPALYCTVRLFFCSDSWSTRG